MASSSSSTRVAWAATTSPASVSPLARPRRSTSFSPTAASSVWRCFVADGWPMREASAAAEIDPRRPTSTSKRRRVGSSASTIPGEKGIYRKVRLEAYGRTGYGPRRWDSRAGWRPTS